MSADGVVGSERGVYPTAVGQQLHEQTPASQTSATADTAAIQPGSCRDKARKGANPSRTAGGALLKPLAKKAAAETAAKESYRAFSAALAALGSGVQVSQLPVETLAKLAWPTWGSAATGNVDRLAVLVVMQLHEEQRTGKDISHREVVRLCLSQSDAGKQFQRLSSAKEVPGVWARIQNLLARPDPFGVSHTFVFREEGTMRVDLAALRKAVASKIAARLNEAKSTRGA